MKTVKLWHLARIHMISMAFWGLAAGLVYSFGGALIDLIETGSLNRGTAIAFLAVVGMPALFALFGLALSVLVALPYNLIARRIARADH